MINLKLTSKAEIIDPLLPSMQSLPKINECYIHGFKCWSDIEFSEHLASLPHYVTGEIGECNNCHEMVKNFKVPITTLAEPITILCDNCKHRLNKFLDTIEK